MVNRNDPRLDYYFNVNTIHPLPFPRDPETNTKLDAVFEEGENKILFHPHLMAGYTQTFMEGPFTVPAADSSAGIMAWVGGNYGVGSP